MNNGLEGVVAADTVLCHVDGNTGTIWVRGHTIADLVANHGFEGTIAIIWDGFAGQGLTRDGSAGRASARRACTRIPGSAPGSTPAPDSICSKACASGSPRCPRTARRSRSRPRCRSRSPRCFARATARRRSRPIPRSAPPPISCACCAARPPPTTRSARWKPISPPCARTGSAIRASPRASRSRPGPRSPPPCVSAYCAFTGPLHGGAPGPVLDMLDEIKASGDIDGWIEAQARLRRPADGVRPSRVSHPRSARRRAARRGGRAQRGRRAASPSRPRSSARRWRRSPVTSPGDPCKATSR